MPSVFNEVCLARMDGWNLYTYPNTPYALGIVQPTAHPWELPSGVSPWKYADEHGAQREVNSYVDFWNTSLHVSLCSATPSCKFQWLQIPWTPHSTSSVEQNRHILLESPHSLCRGLESAYREEAKLILTLPSLVSLLSLLTALECLSSQSLQTVGFIYFVHFFSLFELRGHVPGRKLFLHGQESESGKFFLVIASINYPNFSL